MISLQIEVEPGSGVIKLPHSGRHTPGSHFINTVDRGPPLVSSEPDTMPVRIDFAPAIMTASAGPISDMLGALGFRAKESQLMDTTIPAFLTIQQKFLGNPLRQGGR